MEFPIFKIRASAAYEILAGTIGLTETQQAEFENLTQRKIDFENGNVKSKLTQKMEETLKNLQFKKDNPELPAGAKSYCEKWVKEKLYDRRKNFQNKYLEKGIACEDSSISYASEHLQWGNISKNDEWFSDDHMEGTPDIITMLEKPTIIDMKNVWDCFTMPLFEKDIPTMGYEVQLQVYMHLVSQEYKVDFNEAILCYALMSAPLNVMEREMRKLSWEEGHQGLITDEIRQRVHREMDYDECPPELRLKTYTVTKNTEIIEAIKYRVELCREYIKKLLNNQ